MNDPGRAPPSTSIALRYDANEDRLLVAIDAGSAVARGYWLTRRSALKLIEAANPYLDRMSPLVGHTPVELRGDLATMEREMALASTRAKLGRASAAALESAAAAAELVVQVTISRQPQGFRLEFRGRKGSRAAVACSRAELQRIIHMTEQEAAKARWREPASAPPSETREAKRRAH